jgi:hypothetical protein
MKEELRLVDSYTTNSILRKTNIVCSERATIVLLIGMQVTIENTLIYFDSTRTLLSYRDIRKNGLYGITHEKNNKEFLHIIKRNEDGHDILERIPSLSSGLYYTCIKLIPNITYNVIFQNVDAFTTWHERLEHSEVGLMRKIIGNSTDHNLNTVKFPKSLDFMCTSYASRKLIVRLSPLKIKVEPLKFLEKIQRDICGPIKLLLGSFRYFMVLIDASMQWSHVCLLSTCNHVFAKFITQAIRLKVNFPEHRLQSVWLDNTA